MRFLNIGKTNSSPNSDNFMTDSITLFWFRRDLRLADNAGLSRAFSFKESVLPIFIFDVNLLTDLPQDDKRVALIHSLLSKVNDQLKKSGKSLAAFHGDPIEIVQMLCTKYKVNRLIANEDYEPYAISRDSQIRQLLGQKGILFETIKDQVLFQKNEIVKPDGNPYVVFTPYSNKWKAQLQISGIPNFGLLPDPNQITAHEFKFPTLDELGFSNDSVEWTSNLNPETIKNYEADRNFPAINGISKISPLLRFGAISVRDAVKMALLAPDEKFLNELIWREFFMQILWHFPRTVTHAFKPAYDHIKWRNDPREYKSWCEGKTGYPLVDAGMRELNETGFMHNRVRLVTASFLCKHLLIDWRLGETYFAGKLLDYEQSSNVGNWQWASGSGVDAAPYFRIFNPIEQQKKFDKDFQYISKWIPEFGTADYPEPIVEHKLARERCLETYKSALA